MNARSIGRGGTPAPLAGAATTDSAPSPVSSTLKVVPETTDSGAFSNVVMSTQPLEFDGHPVPSELLTTVLRDALVKLDEVQGADEVKKLVRSLLGLMWINRQRAAANLPQMPLIADARFRGPDGSGKGNSADRYAQVLCAMGVLRTSRPVRLDRSDLLNDGVSGTREAIAQVLSQCRGKMVILERAHELETRLRKDDRARDVASALATLASDDTGFVLVVAGRNKGVKQLLEACPELNERLAHDVKFDELDRKCLRKTIDRALHERGYHAASELIDTAAIWLVRHPDGSKRTVLAATSMVDRAIARQAARLFKKADETPAVSPEQLTEITEKDLLHKDEKAASRASQFSEATLERLDGFYPVLQWLARLSQAALLWRLIS